MKLKRKELEFYLIECENKRLSSHTLKAYKIDLNQFYQFIKDEDVNKENLTLYIQKLNKQYKPKTVRRKLASLHAFFEQLVFDEVISENPMDKIRYKIRDEKILPKTIRYEYLKNIFSLLDQTDDPFQKRNKVVIELLLSTGIRVSELCSLTYENVDLDSKLIRVYGKGGKERIIYLTDDIVELINEYIKEYAHHTKDKNIFIINNHYKPISDQSIRRIIRKYVALSDLHVRITPHMFRHTFATMLLEQDVDISYIQKILGHSSLRTTQIYAYVSQQRQKEILLNKNPIFLIQESHH